MDELIQLLAALTETSMKSDKAILDVVQQLVTRVIELEQRVIDIELRQMMKEDRK